MAENALTRGLGRLQQLVDEAAAEHADAKAAADRAVAVDLPEVIALRDHQEALFFRKPGAEHDPARERALIAALCAAVVQNPDLKLESLGGSRFRVDDLGPQRRLREARERLHEAARCRDEFAAQHAAEFEELRRGEQRQAFRAAVEEADVDALRKQLGVGQPTALRTTDFNSPGS
jgi:hypothetical protein